MTPAELARLHAASFPEGEAWSPASIAATLDSPHTELWHAPGGFALTRTVAGEAELLTLATDPAMRRRGIARALLRRWLATLPGRATTAFLEVAADNAAAIALYDSLGFARTGVRRGYYPRTGAPSVDAWLMSRALTLGHKTAPPPKPPESG